MYTRIAVLSLAVTAFAFSATWAADKQTATADNTLVGSIVAVMDGKVSVLGMEGKKITTFKIDKALEIVINGKKGDLKDLKKDLPVTVTYKTDADNVLWAMKIEYKNERPGR